MTALRDRERAERLWAVSADRAPVRRPGLRGALTAPAKALLRPLLRWYVAPLADAQRDFNDVTLKLVDDLHEEVDAGRDQRRVQELEERVLRLERTPRAGTPGAVPAGAVPPPELDYFAFEARMRGSTDGRPRAAGGLRRRLPGCARRCSTWAVVAASFSASCATAGIEARGVDRDPGHGRLLSCRGSRRRAGRRARVISQSSRTARSAASSRRRSSSISRPPALLRLLELAAAKAPARRHPRRRDDEPARARRAEELLRRPDARAAARSRDAGDARAPGGLRER